MNQPKTTKPSAGALRAAKELSNSIGFDLRQVDPSTTFVPNVEVIAQIIDRETGVAELLEAARLADLALRDIAHHIPPDSEADKMGALALERLQQAIAKCERSE